MFFETIAKFDTFQFFVGYLPRTQKQRSQIILEKLKIVKKYI